MSIRKGVNRNIYDTERQKPVTDKYRDNYDRIFSKKCCGDYANGLCPGCPNEENVDADSAADDFARRSSDPDIDNGANCLYCVNKTGREPTDDDLRSYKCKLDDQPTWVFEICDNFEGTEMYARHYGGNVHVP